jgi:hypothetical protein
MDWYLDWVTQNPLTSAAIQFAILGTLGETISRSLQHHRWTLPGTPVQVVQKLLAWAVLGVVIKYGFVGMRGFVSSLIEHNLLPQAFSGGLLGAHALSVATNLMFGPQMMFFHRIEDNLIVQQWNWTGLRKAWLTLLWFWIPAHTLTFMLPREYQIGLAAVWSVALGVIMGLTTPRMAVDGAGH